MDMTGALGDGAGKWRLEVEADRPILVLSLLATPTGHITNLSTAPRLVSASTGGDQPPAPTVEVTGAREFRLVWKWSVEAGETYAFDYAARLDGGDWNDGCDAYTAQESREATLYTTWTTTNDLPAGTVIEGRYRYRNASACGAGSPGAWSPAGQVTVEGDGGTGGAPDLVVQSPSVNDANPDAGASFRFSATVRNRGDGEADATTLRYYRSSNATISTGDTEVGTDAVGRLAAARTSAESITLTAAVHHRHVSLRGLRGHRPGGVEHVQQLLGRSRGGSRRRWRRRWRWRWRWRQSRRVRGRKHL